MEEHGRTSGARPGLQTAPFVLFYGFWQRPACCRLSRPTSPTPTLPRRMSCTLNNRETSTGRVTAIYRANLDGSHVELVAATRAFSEGIALDVANRHVYWTNYNGEIRRIGFGGTGEVLLRSEGQRIYGLALDLVNRRMYWTAADHPVYRSSLSGASRRLISVSGSERSGGT